MPRPKQSSQPDAGAALIARIVDDLPDTIELDERERVLLEKAAACADELVLIEAGIKEHGAIVVGSKGQPRPNPLLAEARATRLAISRLLGALELDPPRVQNPTSARASKAARARWAQERARNAGAS